MPSTKHTRSFRIMVAPNGARRQKSDHANLPLSSAELAKTAKDCFAAGADAIHLHVRDGAGKHSLDVGRYKDAIAAVAEAAPQMGIQITTESAGIFEVADQMACLKKLRPDAASISVREMARDEKLAAKTYQMCQEAGTDVQHILYSRDCVLQLQHWQRAGVIPDRSQNVICVIGSYGSDQGARLDDFSAVSHGQNWWACAFGVNEHLRLKDVMLKGGNLRIGFENSLCDADGEHASNAASIRKFLAGLASE